MNTPIIRKPKFMRNDSVMITYIDVARSISEVMCRSELTLDEKYDLMKALGECLNKASKAGGFLSTMDFVKWMNRQINT